MNTDVVVAVSDRATDELDVLFNTDDGRAYLADRQGRARAVVDDARALRAVVDLQRAGRDQDRQAARPRARRRDHHRRDRRRRDVPERAATNDAGRYFAGDFDEVDAGEVFGEHLARRDDRRTCSSCTERTERGSSTSATTRGSSSRGRRSTCSASAKDPVSGRTAQDRDRLGPDDRGVQREDRSPGGRVSASAGTLPSALVCAGCGASPALDDPYPFRCPNADGR